MSQNALERLCRIYWRPIYSFICRRGENPHDAEDLTQAFFSSLIERETIKKAEREKGKFRTFLLAALTNFLADEWAKQRCLKRGGGYQIVPLTNLEEDGWREPVSSLDPETVFDRRWALSLIHQVTSRLSREFAEAGKSQLFEALQPIMAQELIAEQCAAIASATGMSEGAIKVALHRLRRRFGQLLREEVAQTVSTAGEIDDELRHLFAAMEGL